MLTLIFSITSLFSVLTAQAEKTPTPPDTTYYEAHTPCPKNDTKSREDGLRQAFLQVLTRISGNAELHNNRHVTALLDNSKTYVHSYHYIEKNCIHSDESCSFLIVNFDPKSIKSALKSIHEDNTRPPKKSLLWLTQQHPFSKSLIAKNTYFENAVQLQAEQLGNNTILPNGNHDDQQIVACNLSDQDKAKILQNKYHTDTVIMGRIDYNNHQNIITWAIHQEQSPPIHSANSGVSISQALQHVMRDSLDLQKQTHQSQFQPKEILLNIHNISSFQDLQIIKQYLHQNNMIDHIKLLQSSTDTTQISIHINSPVRSLIHDLQPIFAITNNDNTLELEYRHAATPTISNR